MADATIREFLTCWQGLIAKAYGSEQFDTALK